MELVAIESLSGVGSHTRHRSGLVELYDFCAVERRGGMLPTVKSNLIGSTGGVHLPTSLTTETYTPYGGRSRRAVKDVV